MLSLPQSHLSTDLSSAIEGLARYDSMIPIVLQQLVEALLVNPGLIRDVEGLLPRRTHPVERRRTEYVPVSSYTSTFLQKKSKQQENWKKDGSFNGHDDQNEEDEKNRNNDSRTALMNTAQVSFPLSSRNEVRREPNRQLFFEESKVNRSGSFSFNHDNLSNHRDMSQEHSRRSHGSRRSVGHDGVIGSWSQEPNDMKAAEEAFDECPICMENLEYNDKVLWMLTCGHYFHAECLGPYLQGCLEEGRVPIGCPQCSIEISKDDLETILPREELDHYMDLLTERTLMIDVEVVHCPTPDCSFKFLADTNATFFKCETCQVEYCLSCETKWHKGMDCRAYRHESGRSENERILEEKKLADMMNMFCPSCRTWVHRIQGCRHMTCKLCKTEFCHYCGDLWNKFCHCPSTGTKYTDGHVDYVQEQLELRKKEARK